MESESPRKQTRVTMGTSSDNQWKGSSREDAAHDTISNEAVEPSNKFTLEALSNYLVLQNVFGNLNNNDLEACCQVNKCWESVADRIYIRNYNIEIKKAETSNNYNHESDVTKSNYLTIKTIASTINNTVATKFNYTFPEACIFLQEALKSPKISLNLSTDLPYYYQVESIKDFLSEFGHLVRKFSPNISISTGILCEKLVKYFPNLQCLNLADAQLYSTGPNFNTNLPENQLKHLWTIYYTTVERSHKNLVAILSIAPNLKEFYNFPLLHLKALVITQKAEVVKSLVYPTSFVFSNDEFEYDDEYENDSDDEHGNGEAHPNRETFNSALEKFADLEPKLAEFSFSLGEDCRDDYFSDEPRQSATKRILQSSHDSLQRLSTFLWVPFDLNGISPFTSLTKIEFVYGEENCGPEIFKDSNRELLPKLFPKVTVLEFPSFNAKYFPPLLPENGLSLWGSQIEELQMKECNNMTADVILTLSQSFTSVKNFQFSIQAAPENLKPIFPVIAEKWPALEFLTIKLQGCDIRDIKGEPCTFDSLFLGISDDKLEQLKDPLTRTVFTPEEIKEFRVGSPLVKMSNLKTFEIDFANCKESEKFIDRLSTITFVSKEFVFDFVPHLKFIFRIKGDKFPGHLQAALSSLFKLEIKTPAYD